MASVVEATVCTIEIIGHVRQSKYENGENYQPVMFRKDGIPGKPGEIWKNMTVSEVRKLERGDRVQLVEIGSSSNGTPKHQIVMLEKANGQGQAPSTTNGHNTYPQPRQQFNQAPKQPVAAPVPAPAPEPQVPDYAPPGETIGGQWPGQLKRELATYAQDYLAFYKFCFDRAQQMMPGMSEQGVRAIASGLMISACKKFDL